MSEVPLRAAIWHDLNGYERAQELQRALIEAAGEPPSQLMEIT